MIDNQYYIPKIEDIRVGYECEVKVPTTDAFEHDTWKSFILENRSSKWGGDCSELDEVINKIRLGQTRTPYLTKKQIEAEGWESLDLSKGFAYRNGVPDYRAGFRKGNFFLTLDTRKPHVEIWAADVTLIDWLPEFPESFRVNIPCPSINEFRQISKLLGI